MSYSGIDKVDRVHSGNLKLADYFSRNRLVVFGLCSLQLLAQFLEALFSECLDSFIDSCFLEFALVL